MRFLRDDVSGLHHYGRKIKYTTFRFMPEAMEVEYGRKSFDERE